MPLEVVDLPLTSLIPIQSVGLSAPHLAMLAAEGYSEPIEAIVFRDGLSLLVEGHHRSYIAYQRGQETIPALHAVDDEGVLCLRSLAIEGCRSIEDVHTRYREWWLPNLQAANIVSIATLPVKNIPRPFL